MSSTGSPATAGRSKYGMAMAAADRSTKTSERVARLILDDVISRGAEPGSMLPTESIMLERYRVGRASLREGLRILEAHGLIVLKPGPGGGPVVGEVTGEDFGRTSSFFYHAVGATLRELLEARTAIEPMMAGLAAKGMTPEAAEQLREVVAVGEAAIDQPPEVWAHASSAFHTVVGQVAGNRVLGLFASSLVEIHNVRLHPIFPGEGRQEVIDVHKKIADAILAADATKAERLMRRHIELQLVGNLQRLVPGLLNETIDWR